MPGSPFSAETPGYALRTASRIAAFIPGSISAHRWRRCHSGGCRGAFGPRWMYSFSAAWRTATAEQPKCRPSAGLPKCAKPRSSSTFSGVHLTCRPRLRRARLSAQPPAVPVSSASSQSPSLPAPPVSCSPTDAQASPRPGQPGDPSTDAAAGCKSLSATGAGSGGVVYVSSQYWSCAQCAFSSPPPTRS